MSLAMAVDLAVVWMVRWCRDRVGSRGSCNNILWMAEERELLLMLLLLPLPVLRVDYET
jgi:hypothetical protein